MVSMINKYNGLRKVTISTPIAAASTQASGDTPAAPTRDSIVLLGRQIGSDGLDVEADPIEQAIETFNNTAQSPQGIELKAGTLNLVLYSIEDKGKVLRNGYDAATNTWNMFDTDCDLSDVTLAFERVCQNSDGTNGVNFIFRHAQLSNAHEINIKRATTQVMALSFYPQWVEASEYGITGDNSTRAQAWQEYYGVYDGTTDTIKYDAVPKP